MNQRPSDQPSLGPAKQRPWVLVGVLGAASVLILLITFLLGALLGRFMEQNAEATSRVHEAATTAAQLTAQPTATTTFTATPSKTPTATQTQTPTPDVDATAMARALEVAAAVNLTLAAHPTDTSTPIPSPTLTPANTWTLASTPTRTPEPDFASTRNALALAVADGVALTLAAQPSDTLTSTPTPSPTLIDTETPTSTVTLTPTPDRKAIELALVREIAQAIALTLTAQPTDTSTSTPTSSPTPTDTGTPTSTVTQTPAPDRKATELARSRDIAQAVALTLTAQPTDTSTSTPDLKATELARSRDIVQAVALTLTAQPTDTPTSTPDRKVSELARLRDIAQAAALMLTAQPSNTPTLTPTWTPKANTKATEWAWQQGISGAVAATLTAMPPPICTPSVRLPSVTPWTGSIDTPALRPLVMPTDTPLASCIDHADFVGDLTVPDGMMLESGVPFSKTWRVSNSGSCVWGPGYQLRFVSGDRMSAPASVAVFGGSPGAMIDLTVPQVAPDLPGSYRGVWQMANEAGELFGDRLVVSIHVPAPSGFSIKFWSDVPYISAGECTTLHWDVEGVREVHLDGQPVTGQGHQQVCLCERTTYALHVIRQDGQPEDHQVTIDVYGTCETPPESPSEVVIEFGSDAFYVDAGQCTTLHWNVEGVREVYLDDQPVVGQGSQQVCLCEPETYTLHVIKTNDQSEDRQVTVDVYGACETMPETVIEFYATDTSVDAGECTFLFWRVEGVSEVYLDDEPVKGSGKRQVCLCEPQTFTLTVVRQDDSAEDLPVYIDVSGSCQTPKLTEPLLPIAPIIPPIRFVPLETVKPLLW